MTIDLELALLRQQLNVRQLKHALSGLLAVINRDSQGDFFICQEAANRMERARQLIDRIELGPLRGGGSRGFRP
jgi:hypothetical protein